MAFPPYAPFVAVVVGFFFLIIGYRSILKREVYDSKGNVRTTRNLGYYLRTTLYIVLGMLLLTLSTLLFYNQYGFAGLAFVIAGLVLVAFVLYRIRKWRSQFKNYLDVRLSSPRKINRIAGDAWPLAAVGPVAQVNGQDFHTLAGVSVNDYNRNMAKRRLAREWEAPNQEAFTDLLDWLFETGHRTEFHGLVDRISRMGEEETDHFLESLHAGQEGITDKQEIEEMAHRVEMIRNNQGQVNQQGFMAWDLIRFLELSRWGFLAGYMSDAEAQDRMYTASQVLQARFDSWDELYRNYLLGMEFWSVVEMRREGPALKKAVERFLKDTKGPWAQIPWGMSLRSGNLKS